MEQNLWILSLLEYYSTTFGGFDTNYIIFRNVEIFLNFFFK
jgi:hypothetical protein